MEFKNEDMVSSVFTELKVEREMRFRDAVKNKLNLIIALQCDIAVLEEKMKKVQKELHEMTLPDLDKSKIIGL